MQVARHGVFAMVKQRCRGFAGAGTVEACDRRAGLLGDHGRFQEPLGVDDQVIATHAQCAAQAGHLAPCAAIERLLAPAPDRHLVDAFYRRVQGDDAGEGLFHAPVEAYVRAIAERILDSRERMDDVTHR